MEQKQKRHKEIRNELLKNKKVYVNELATKLKVSTRTIRSDLAELSGERKCILFHGGAKIYNKPTASLFNEMALHGIKNNHEIKKEYFSKIKQTSAINNKIYILGSFNIDMVMEVDKLPKSQETRHASSTEFFPGGKGLNQALAASKINNNVHLTVKIGCDHFGSQAKDYLPFSGIQSIKVLENKSCGTGHAIILNSLDNEYLITCNLSANETISINEIEQDFDLIEDSTIFLTQLENNFDITKLAILKAHELNKTVILHLSPYRPQVTELLPQIDILTLGTIEAEAISTININCMESAKKALSVIHAKGIKHSIIFFKNKGYLWFDGKQYHLFPIYKSAVIDTSGMMDAFTGALAGCLANQLTMHEAIAFSRDFAALKIERKGASNMPERELVQVFNQLRAKT